jgi:hypothetical protein
MRPKIIGIGKCGSRIAFDFSAYTYRHPAAYELRLDYTKTVGKLTGKLASIKRSVSGWLIGSHSPERLWRDYISGAIDSDYERNEILRVQSEYIEERHKVRPLTVAVPVGTRSGGCDYGFISSAVTRYWLNQYRDSLIEKDKMLAPIFDNDDENRADFCLVVTSLGGGTGSGSAQIIGERIIEHNAQELSQAPFHVSIAGILPVSDEAYGDEWVQRTWDLQDKINMGRAVARFLGSQDDVRQKLGLWLISNDILLRGLDRNRSGDADILNENAITMINFHLASVACLVANIGGISPATEEARRVSALTNFDATEMNNHLGGKLYLTAYSRANPGQLSSYQDMTRYARELVISAFSTLRLDSGLDADAPTGCSIPFRTSEWNHKVLEAWSQSMGSFSNVDQLPIDLRSAGWVGILYGQDEQFYNDYKVEATRSAVQELCPGADISTYPFRHKFGHGDYVCLFVADFFNRVVYRSLLEYCVACFSSPPDIVTDLATAFKITDLQEGHEAVADICNQNVADYEVYSENRFGREPYILGKVALAATEQAKGEVYQGVAETMSPKLVTREEIATAFQRLYEAYQRKPRRLPSIDL